IAPPAAIRPLTDSTEENNRTGTGQTILLNFSDITITNCILPIFRWTCSGCSKNGIARAVLDSSSHSFDSEDKQMAAGEMPLGTPTALARGTRQLPPPPSPIARQAKLTE